MALKVIKIQLSVFVFVPTVTPFCKMLPPYALAGFNLTTSSDLFGKKYFFKS
jgi:hypothetical protein